MPATAIASAITPTEPGPGQQARADTYRLLAALLTAPPNNELLAILRGLQVADSGGTLTPAWAALRDAATAADPQALEQEFFALFIGLGRGEVLPYASWYLSGFLMERPLATLRGRLAELGFSRQTGSSEPEDHAAALCEVMAELVEPDGPQDRQRAFFDEFVGAWMGQFFSDLTAADSAHFYAAVGQLGKGFLAIEQGYFRMPD